MFTSIHLNVLTYLLRLLRCVLLEIDSAIERCARSIIEHGYVKEGAGDGKLLLLPGETVSAK